MTGRRLQACIVLPLSPPLTPIKHNKLSSLGLKTLYPTQPLSLTHLSSSVIRSLAKHLSSNCSTLVTIPKPSLPANLCNSRPLPQATTISTLHRLGASDALPPASKLCNTHNHLNAQIIASVLSTIETELEDYLPALLARIGNDGNIDNPLPSLTALQLQGTAIGDADLKLVRKGYKHLSPLALHHVQAAEDILSLILPPDEFNYFYRRDSTTFSNPQAGTSKSKNCDAHLITHLTSSPSALIGLRGIMFARATPDILAAEKKCPQLELIEGFISGFGAQAPWMLSVSGRIGWEMRVLREKSEIASLGRMPVRPVREVGGKLLETRIRGTSIVSGLMSPMEPPKVRYATKPLARLALQMPVRMSCVPAPLRIGGRREADMSGHGRGGIAV